jgi:hypothetical protein
LTCPRTWLNGPQRPDFIFVRRRPMAAIHKKGQKWGHRADVAA